MKASELITRIQEQIDKVGDLPIRQTVCGAGAPIHMVTTTDSKGWCNPSKKNAATIDIL